MFQTGFTLSGIFACSPIDVLAYPSSFHNPVSEWLDPFFLILPLSSVAVRLGPVLAGPALCASVLRGVPLMFVV